MANTSGIRVIGVRGKEISYISAVINIQKREAVKAHAERTGCSTNLVIRNGMKAFIKQKQAGFRGSKRIDFLGNDSEKVKLSVCIPSKLADDFRSAAKASGMTPSIALRSVVDQLISAD